jgi:uridine kinase
LRNDRSINIVTDFAEETARTYRKHSYRFRNVDVILLEGVFLFRRDHRELLDLAIWVDCSFSTALARALTRKQEGLSLPATIRAYETIYFPAQKIHIEKDQPREGADLILANDPYLRPQSFCQRDVPLMTTTRRGNEL